MKSDILNNEINLIENLDIRKWTKDTLENVSEYFWVAQASSSGRWHPECTNKKGGLIVHTKRVVYLANRICDCWDLTGLDKDIVISASILHDIAKVPNTKVMHSYGMTVTDEDFTNHPLNAEKYFSNGKREYMSNNVIYSMILNAVKFHMGRWTPEAIKKPLLEYSLIELAVTTCDFMATTKTLVTPVDTEETNV